MQYNSVSHKIFILRCVKTVSQEVICFETPFETLRIKTIRA